MMRSKVLKYLILLALALLIVAISSFWFSGASFKESDVVLELEGPTQISSGDEVVYKLKYENKTRSTLYDLNFVFFYPEGSTIVTNNGVKEDQIEDFSIEKLSPGESGEKEFPAFLVGERGSIKIAKMVLSFRAGDLRSSFEKTTSFSTTIISTPISLTLAAPPSVVPGADLQYILDYRNESNDDISDLIVELNYPDGFSPKIFEPSPNVGNNSWFIQSLRKGEGGRILINGSLDGPEGESKVVSAKLRHKVGGTYVDYQKVFSATIISNPILGLSLFVNDAVDYTAALGDKLTYGIKYKNNSNISLSNLNLEVRLEGEMFDLSKLDTKGGFYDDTSNTITWNSSTVPEFLNFISNSAGQVSFSVFIKSSFSSSVPGASSDKFIKVSARLSTPNIPAGIETGSAAVSSGIITKIGTQPTLNQLSYYNDPDFGSSGPMPPRVGEESFFTIHWQLTNPGNDMENVKITAKLPTGATWDNETRTTENQPAPSFNSNLSEVIWNLGRLPYGTGIIAGKYEASFRIKIKPSVGQAGSSALLLENIQFSGIDSFTRQSIVINKPNVTTDSSVDRPREGTVQ